MNRQLSLIQWTEGTSGQNLINYSQRLEALGYSELWLPEIFGREPLATCGYLLAITNNINISSGIANVYARDADNARQGANTLAELSNGRFRLGLGVSHPQLVEPRGHPWEAPVKKMRGFLERYHVAPLESPLASNPAPVIVAGHGKGLMNVAKRHADGSLLFLQPVEVIQSAREILGPDKEIHAVVRCVLDANPKSARELARRANAFYISLPAYHARWAELGFNKNDWLSGGSDKLIDAVCMWGEKTQLEEKLERYFEAGATHVVLYPCNPDENYSENSAVSRNWNWPLLEALSPT